MMTVSALPEFMQAATMALFGRACVFSPSRCIRRYSPHPHTERRIRQEFLGNLALVTLDFEFAQPGCGDTSSAFMYCRTSLATGLALVRID
jgi:hypothetical protein